MQLFAALGKGSGESDRVGTLEVQLEQERSERKVLMDKIKKLEEYQVQGWIRVTSPSPSTEHKDYYYFQFQVLL